MCKQQNISVIVCPIALWTSLQLGYVSTMDVNTDWKFPRIFIFYEPEKAIKLAQKIK